MSAEAGSRASAVGAALLRLEESREELTRALNLIPRKDRQRRPTEGRWSAAEILEHLVRVETQITALLRRGSSAGEEGRPARPLDPDLLRDRTRRVRTIPEAEPRGDVPWEGAWTALAEARSALHVAVEGAPAAVWSTVLAEHFVFGPLDGLGWLHFLSGHEVRHAGQLVELAGALGATRPAPG